MFRSTYYESDQKDIVIAQLKAEIFEAQTQREQALQLEEEIRKMEVKEQMAGEERQIIESEHRMRHEQALWQINALKNEADTLRKLISEKSESDNLQRDQLAEINDQKTIESQNLKKELIKNQDVLSQGNHQLAQLATKFHQLDYDLQNSIAQYKEYKYQLEDLQLQINAKEAHVNKQQSIKIQTFDEEIKQIQAEIDKINEEISKEQPVYNNYQLQKDIDKISDDLHYSQVDTQKLKKIALLEQQKKYDLQSKFTHFKQIVDRKQQAHDSVVQELNSIKDDNSQVIATNNKMKEDWKALQKHIELLMEVNQDLVSLLDSFNNDDHILRQLLNRQSRVKELQLRLARQKKSY